MGAKRKPLPEPKVSHVTDLPKTVEQVNKSDKNKMFSVRTANARITEAKKIDIPKKLFGSFVYSEGLTVFYGNTHAGKTAVAMNIAEAIASGKQLSEIPMEAEPQRCVFFDFELSDKNFELKSSEEYQNHYIYSDNLITVTPDLDKMDASQITAKFIIDSIKSVVGQLQAKVFFIDNISWLEQNGLETSKEANKLMKELWVLSRSGYAVVVLAHTTKKYDSDPMTLNTLAGSAAVSRYLESCFAINWSAVDKKKMRYIKQLKNRWGEMEYGADNVLPILIGVDKKLTFHKVQDLIIQKEDGNGVKEDLDLTKEASHLKTVMTVGEREEFIKANVLSGEMNQSDAARAVGVSRQQISRDVKKLSNGEFFDFDNQGIEIKKP
jgi:hypothetical protein